MTHSIGICGYAHEANAFAQPLYRRNAREPHKELGGLGAAWEASWVVQTLHDAGASVVELPVLEFPAGGPVSHADFVAFTDELRAGLQAAPHLSGLVVLGHGAGLTTSGTNADGAILRALRDVVGADLPIAVVLDLHANLSAEMVECATIIVGYRTNPHIDIAARLVEATSLLLEACNGADFVTIGLSLPLLISQLGQLTTPGEPLGELIATGSEAVLGPIRCVSVFGGFSLGDSADAGLSITVTAQRHGLFLARRLATDLATQAFQLRHRFRRVGTPLDVALRAACLAPSPLLLADVADNPGGGAPATSVALLQGLLELKVTSVCLGLQCDAAVVRDAQHAGTGSTFTAKFNRTSTSSLAVPLSAEATVTHLTEGTIHPTLGVYAGATLRPGPTCGLLIDGIHVGVSSQPVQVSDASVLNHAGLDPTGARVVVVKSRGHFRAGFSHLFTNAQILEVSAPGVAPVDLELLRPVHLRRPLFPLDEALDDEAAFFLHVRRFFKEHDQ